MLNLVSERTMGGRITNKQRHFYGHTTTGMWDNVMKVNMLHRQGADNRDDIPGDTQSCVGLSRCLFVATL